MTYHVLVLDDDSLIHDSLRLVLPNHWRMTNAYALSDLKHEEYYHAAFIDMRLKAADPKATGLEAVEKLSAHNPQIEIIAMSGALDLATMEKAIALGARKFLAKPLSKDEVLNVLGKIESLIQLKLLHSPSTHTQWLGRSSASMEVKKQIASLRGEPGPLLIEGETGTGKEVAAQLLHAQEGSRPFVAVNIAAIPENLFEAELFGYTKGSFTGADQNRIGLAEAAQGGDLFLDEIEALSLPMQVKLLRFLESGEVRRVGARETTHVKTRVIVASNQKLADLVKAGKFREDLLFRLSGRKLQLPPLRDRKEDIADLSHHFLAQEKPRRHKQLTQEAIEFLKTYSWPGNVRELKRILEQASLFSPLPLIREEDLRPLLSSSTQLPSQQIDMSQGLNTLVSQFEAQIIRQAMQSTKDVDDTAKLLQISRSSLYKKIKDYGIEVTES